MRVLALLFGLLLANGLTVAQNADNWTLLQRYPHDPDAFTQGLVIVGDRIYESSGRYGQSWVEYRPAPDRQVQHSAAPIPDSTAHSEASRLRKAISRRWFAEGLTQFDDRLFLLTWREGLALVLDPDTLAIRRQFRYPGEGWGLTHDGRRLIMSDGSSELRFVDPDSFTELYRLKVTEEGQPLRNLNELEWVDGWLLANIWQSDDVAIIDPVTGNVAGRLRLASLYPPGQRHRNADVLNGLAWDPADCTLLVTGKLWPDMYRLRIHLPDRTDGRHPSGSGCRPDRELRP